MPTPDYKSMTPEERAQAKKTLLALKERRDKKAAISALDALNANVAYGVSFGKSPDAIGYLQSKLTGEDPKKISDEYRERLRLANEKYPVLSNIADMFGSAAATAVPGGRALAAAGQAGRWGTIFGKMGVAAAEGAAQAAGRVVDQSEAQAAKTGAALGLATSGAVDAVSKTISRYGSNAMKLAASGAMGELAQSEAYKSGRKMLEKLFGMNKGNEKQVIEHIASPVQAIPVKQRLVAKGDEVLSSLEVPTRQPSAYQAGVAGDDIRQITQDIQMSKIKDESNKKLASILDKDPGAQELAMSMLSGAANTAKQMIPKNALDLTLLPIMARTIGTGAKESANVAKTGFMAGFGGPVRPSSPVAGAVGGSLYEEK